MTTRFRSPSALGRVRTIALASTLALSMIMPTAIAVRADAGIATTPNQVGTGFSVDTANGLSGLTAVITGAGAGVNLRAEPAHDATVLATVANGTVVGLRIDQTDTVSDADGITRWWPVTANGQDGWISGVYLAASGTTEPSAASTTPPATVAPQQTIAPTQPPAGTAQTPVTSGVPADSQGAFALQSPDITGQIAVVSAGGQGVNLRADPSNDSKSLASVPDGTTVALRIDQVDTVVDANGARWWPVTVNGQDGWISGYYLINSGTAGTTPTTSGATFAAGTYAAVKTKEGDGLNIRADAAPTASVLTTIADGTVVQIMSGPASHDNSTNGWYLVTVNGTTGYADGDLLIPASQPNIPAPTATAQNPAFKIGDTVVVKTDTKNGLNIRQHAVPTAAKTGFVPEGTTLKIINGPSSFNNSTNGWYQITYNGVTGFVDGDNLALASGTTVPTTPATTATTTAPATTPTPAPTATSAPASSAAFAKDDYVAIKTASGVGANVRINSSLSATKVGYLADGSVVQVTDGPKNDTQGNSWYEVTDGGNVTGWVLGSLLTASSAPQTSTQQPVVSSQGFIWPIDGGTVTQGFGCSNLGFYAYDPAWGCPVHDGLDIAAPSYTPIHAAAAGTVVAAGWCDCGLGYYVEIDHGNGVHTLYGHMAEQPYVSVGQQVSQGETIGPVGATGLATGPHTHFMVKINGVAQDPQSYLP